MKYKTCLKNTLFFLILIIANSLTGQTDLDTQKNDNPFLRICECKNSNELTVDEYVSIESKKQHLSSEDFISNVDQLMRDKESWLLKDFFMDKVYTDNIKAIVINMAAKDEPMTEEKGQALLDKVQNKYPACWGILPVFLTMVGG